MKSTDRLKKKINNYLYDHIFLKNTLDISKSSILSILGALLYAIGFVCFITPANPDPSTIEGSSITTGGVGGLSQVLTLLLRVCKIEVDTYTMHSICYFVINIPILLFGFFKIGKRFSLLSLLNVGLSSLFISAFKEVAIVNEITKLISDQHLTRVVFSGVAVGLASACAYKGDTSCGGIDVISYYFAIKKSTNVGKYTASVNACIISTYFVLTCIANISEGGKPEIATLNLLYSITYVFISSSVVDIINTRNKKVQIQIVSENNDISAILIANFPHSTTKIHAEGGYSHKNKNIVLMTVSSNEVKKVVSTAKRADPKAFITVTPLIQAYGNFYIKPIE